MDASRSDYNCTYSRYQIQYKQCTIMYLARRDQHCTRLGVVYTDETSERIYSVLTG